MFPDCSARGAMSARKQASESSATGKYFTLRSRACGTSKTNATARRGADLRRCVLSRPGLVAPDASRGTQQQRRCWHRGFGQHHRGVCRGGKKQTTWHRRTAAGTTTENRAADGVKVVNCVKRTIGTGNFTMHI